MGWSRRKMLNGNVLKRCAAVIATALLLAGCVLQSPEPLFAEGDGAPALAPLAKSYRAEVYENDAWKRQDGSAIFTGEGNHYVMSNSKDKDVMEMLFVDLGKARYVVQTQDHKQSKDPYIYFFADVRGDGIYLAIPDCDTLKTLPNVKADVVFENYDCTLKGKPARPFFASLAGEMKDWKMRLVPEK